MKQFYHMERQKYNKLILETLSKLVEKYPNLRFGQILVDCNIIELVPDHFDCAMIALDPFNEESKETWEKVKKIMYKYGI